MLGRYLSRRMAVHRKSTLNNQLRTQTSERREGIRILFLISALCILLSERVVADYEPVDVTDGGTITGLVKFPGETAPAAMYTNRDEPNCPHGIAQDHLLVKQENRGIQNVLIILEIHRGKPAPRSPAQLVNENCVFRPRVQWVSKNVNLVLKNNDPALHNVHALSQELTIFNVDLPSGGSPVRRPLIIPGLYQVNCDRHLWMRAWIYVSEHPYVAVTDATGRFTLADVPPGRYTLRAWHEGWIPRGKSSEGRMEFQPMQQIIDVDVHSGRTTDLLLEDLQATFPM